MIPILYEKGETAFTSNGQCRLVDCLSCLVTEERNGIYECEFSYPVTGRGYSKITLGSIIYTTHDDTRTPQPFDIYKRTASIDGVVTFYARHIAYRLANVILKPFTASSCAQTMGLLAANSLTANPFTFWTDKQVASTFKLTYPRSVWDILGGSAGSILDVYGKGTYEFDRFTVKLHLNRGRQTDVSIRYGRDLTELEHTRDQDGLHNSVVPFWRDEESGTVVTVPGWFVTAPGTYLVEYLTTEELDVVVDENSVPIEVHTKTGDTVSVMDLSEAFEEEPTVEQLRQKALSRLTNNKSWEPDENLTVNFTQLWQTSEYENVAALQRVSLCDTVNVVFPEIGLTAEHVQIVKVVYDSLLDRYDSMELGQPSVTLAGLIKQDVERSILEQVPSTSAMERAIDAATQLITGGTGGHVVIASDANGKPNEILIMDTDSVDTAVKVLRINMNGIGFSSTGYAGPFTTAWTLDGGFVADFITSGTIRANLIKAGVLSDEAGVNFWNMESGEFSLQGYPTREETQEIAQEMAEDAVEDQTQVDIFNKLTNYGQNQGIYLHNGRVYLNANYIRAGYIDAERIRAGSITADKIDVQSLFAQHLIATSSFQVDTEDYQLTAGTVDGYHGLTMHAGTNQTGGSFSCYQNLIDLVLTFQDSSSNAYRTASVGLLYDGTSTEAGIIADKVFISGFGGGIQCNGAVSVTSLSSYGAVSAASFTENGVAISSKYSRLLSVESFTKSISVGAKTSANGSFFVSRMGYQALGIVGWQLPSTSSSYLFLPRLYLGDDNFSCYWLARNVSENDYTGSLTVYVLYVKL